MDHISKDLSSTFRKFSESDEKLQRLISSQRLGNSKIGLGFDQAESSNQTKKKTVFVKGEETKDKIPVNFGKISMNTKSFVQERYVRRYAQQINYYPVRRYFRQSVRRFDRRYSNQVQKKPVRSNPYACFFCNKVGHIEKHCYDKNYKLSKQQATNLSSTSLSFGGPKLVWVPKKV